MTGDDDKLTRWEEVIINDFLDLTLRLSSGELQAFIRYCNNVRRDSEFEGSDVESLDENGELLKTLKRFTDQLAATEKELPTFYYVERPATDDPSYEYQRGYSAGMDQCRKEILPELKTEEFWRQVEEMEGGADFLREVEQIIHYVM